MAGVIRLGVKIDPELPRNALSPDEMADLRKLIAARQASLEQAQVADQRLQLYIVGVRDRRGIVGELEVNPETGAITYQEGGNVNG